MKGWIVLGLVKWLEICTLYNLKCSVKICSISMMRKWIQRNEVLSYCLGINVNTCLHQDVVKENFLEEKNAFLTTKMSWLCCANFFPPPSIVHGLFFYAASMGMGVYCFGIMEVANNKIWESKFNKTGLHSCFDCQTPVWSLSIFCPVQFRWPNEQAISQKSWKQKLRLSKQD